MNGRRDQNDDGDVIQGAACLFIFMVWFAVCLWALVEGYKHVGW